MPSARRPTERIGERARQGHAVPEQSQADACGHQRELRDEGERVVSARAGGGGQTGRTGRAGGTALAPGSRFAGCARRTRLTALTGRTALTRRTRLTGRTTLARRTGGPASPAGPPHRPDRARLPDRAHLQDRRAPARRRDPPDRPVRPRPAHPRARRPRARPPDRPRPAGPRVPGSRGAHAHRQPGPAPARPVPRWRARDVPVRRVAARGAGRLLPDAAPSAAAEGLPAVPLPFGDSVGAAVSGAGSVMVLLDRAVLRVLPVQDQYHQCGQQSRHQQRSEAAQAAGEQGDHQVAYPGPRRRCLKVGCVTGSPGRVLPHMPVFGLHCSHEQVHPSALLAAVPAGRGGRVRRRDVVGPLLAVERPAGPVGVRVVLAGRGAAGHVAAVRRGERARPALPPGDHRPGHRHARRDVPGPVLGGAGHRRGQQRAHHRRRLAAQGACATPGCASASTSSARCCAARRSATTGWSASTGRRSGQPAGRPATAGRRRGQRGHRRAGARSGPTG